MPKNQGVLMDRWTGCNSLLPPDLINAGQVSWALNCMARGGIIQTRPGFDWLVSMIGERVQGAVIFTPKDSGPLMLIAIDGYIYHGKYPYKSFGIVDGLRFSRTAPIINFQTCLKSVKRATDGISLTLIEPTPIVVIQDGVTRAGIYNGVTGHHSIAGAPTYGIPIGLWMARASSRLWVFNGSRAAVSDIADPESFYEGIFLAESGSFDLPGEVTGAIQTTDEKALLVFTSDTTTAFKSNVRDRTLWGITPEFQKVILPSIGCVSGRSPVNQYGMTWWFSKAGFINLDAAFFTQQSSKTLTSDGEMMRSKCLLAPNLSGICSTYYENLLLISVPEGSKHNTSTWVLDQSPSGQARTGTEMAWAGVWTGVRPVQWLRAEIAGRERLYFASYDVTRKDNTNIHIWEAFQSDRRDNNGRIKCQMETAMAKGVELQRFRYAEIQLCEILGPVELSVFVGGMKGPWHLVKEIILRAEIGPLKKNLVVAKEDILRAWKPQGRTIKTEEFSSQDRACSGPESRNAPGADHGFQLLLSWRGRMGVKSIRIIASEDASADSGECSPDELPGVNILVETGELATA